MDCFDFTTQGDRSCEGSSKWGAMLRARPDVAPGTVPFSVADMEFLTAPPIAAAVAQAAATANLGYAEATPGFCRSVLGWQERRHGWACDPAWMVQSPGVVPALYAAVRAVTAPGDGVLIQSPVYYPFRMAIEDNGRRLVSSPLVPDARGRYVMDLEDLEAKAADPATTAMILCSPHNPVGRVWSREELEAVADICVRNQVFLISDEIHEDLVLLPHRHVPLALAMPAGSQGRCLVCTAPSKTFNIAGLQCSNIFVPDPCVRESLVREQALAGFHSLNCLAYVACEAAYDHCAPWLDAVLEVIAQNGALLRGHLEARWPQTVMSPLEGTYLAWLDLRFTGASPEALERSFQDQGLFFDMGGLFGPEGEGFVRWNLACPRATLEAALPRFDAALAALA